MTLQITDPENNENGNERRDGEKYKHIYIYSCLNHTGGRRHVESVEISESEPFYPCSCATYLYIPVADVKGGRIYLYIDRILTLTTIGNDKLNDIISQNLDKYVFICAYSIAQDIDKWI